MATEDTQELDFEGRVAIVTGAGRGLGRSHAIMLASRGARVVVNDIIAKDADATVAAIGGDCVADYSDVVTGAQGVVATALDRFGQLDILINNAAILRSGAFHEQDPDEWWRVFDVSFRGTVEMTRAAWPHLMESTSARLINTASAGMLANPGMSAYGAAKGAIWALGNTLAAEGRSVGIGVSTLMPTAWTPMAAEQQDPALGQQNPDIQRAMQSGLSSEHVAAFVTYLAHQGSKAGGETFNIGGDRAFRMVLAGLPVAGVEDVTPEAWAEAVDRLLAESDELRPYPTTGSLIAEKLLAVDPGLATALAAMGSSDA